MKRLKITYTILLLISILTTSYGQDGMQYYNEGVDLMEKKNYLKAIEVFSNGIELKDIAKSINYYGRAYANYELEKITEAKLDIKKSLETEIINNERVNSDIYWLKGMIASEEGEIKLEIQSYRKAIEYTPDNDWLKTTLGFALIEDEKNEEAIDILTEAISRNNQNAYAYNNRGLAYMKLGEFERAESDLENSKKLDDQNPFLYKNYFLLYKEKNELENACEAIEEALKMDMSEYGRVNDTNELKKLKKEFCG